jgi:hypothetical protein
MQTTPTALLMRRKFIFVYFLYVALATFAAGLLMEHQSRNWIISDWLINYQAGFVRRGLPGEVLFRVGNLLHVAKPHLVAATYLVLFAVFLTASYRLIRRSSLDYWVLALVLSPATYAMQILNAHAGFRKELLLLAAVAAYLAWLPNLLARPALLISALSALSVVLILSHESLLFYLPYLFVIPLLEGSWRTIRYLILPALFAVCTTFICSHHLGSQTIAEGICHSLGYQFRSGTTDICGSGAIPYLVRDRTFAHRENLDSMRDNNYWKLKALPIALLLTLIPIVGQARRLWKLGLRRDVRYVLAAAALSWLFSVTLFLYATDWGRWVYSHAVCLTLLLVFLDTKLAVGGSRAEVVRHIAGWKVAVLALYALCWALPNDYVTWKMFGYAGRGYTAAHKVVAKIAHRA